MFLHKFGGTWAFNCGLGLAVRVKRWGKSDATSDSFLYLIVFGSLGAAISIEALYQCHAT